MLFGSLFLFVLFFRFLFYVDSLALVYNALGRDPVPDRFRIMGGGDRSYVTEMDARYRTRAHEDVPGTLDYFHNCTQYYVGSDPFAYCMPPKPFLSGLPVQFYSRGRLLHLNDFVGELSAPNVLEINFLRFHVYYKRQVDRGRLGLGLVFWDVDLFKFYWCCSLFVVVVIWSRGTVHKPTVKAIREGVMRCLAINEPIILFRDEVITYDHLLNPRVGEDESQCGF